MKHCRKGLVAGTNWGVERTDAVDVRRNEAWGVRNDDGEVLPADEYDVSLRSSRTRTILT